MTQRDRERQRGIALLAVLWLVVALTAVALTVSSLVRTEVEAVSNQIEAERSYYLARGGVEAAIYSLARSAQVPVGAVVEPQGFEMFLPGQRWLPYDFPGGACFVEVAPENAKLNVNLAPPEQLAALFVSLGLPVSDSVELAAASADWRSPQAPVASPFDLFYAGLPEPYTARHAPLERVEELLPVRGMSRDLFFGRMEQDPEGRWERKPPLADLLTTQPGFPAVNPNYAPYEVLRVLRGWNDAMASAVVQARERAPFRTPAELEWAVPSVSGVLALSPLSFAQGPIYTVTATGVLRDSRVRRTVRALVRVGANLPLYHQVLAWWEDWPVPVEPPQAALAALSSGRLR